MKIVSRSTIIYITYVFKIVSVLLCNDNILLYTTYDELLSNVRQLNYEFKTEVLQASGIRVGDRYFSEKCPEDGVPSTERDSRIGQSLYLLTVIVYECIDDSLT